MSRIRPPLTTSMTGPLTIPSFSLISSIVPHARSYCARFLERMRRPSLSSFWRTSASSSSSSEHDLVGVDVVADRELARRDDAFGLEADVEQHLVAVDLDDRAGDDVAVVELDDRGVDRVGRTTGRRGRRARRARSGPRRPRSSAARRRRRAVGLGRCARWLRLPGRPRWPRRSRSGTVAVVASVASCSDNLTPLRMDRSRRWRDRRARASGPRIEAERHRLQVGARSEAAESRCRSRRASSSSSGWSSVGGCARYAPGVTPWTATTLEPGAAASSSSSRAVKQVVQRSNGCSSPSGLRTRGQLVEHAGGGVELLARPRGSARRRRAENALTARRPPGGACAAMRPKTSASSRPPSRPNPPWHRQIAASNSPSNGEVADVELLERRRRGPRPPPRRGRAATKSGEWSTPTTVDAAPGERERVTPGPHPTSSTRMPRLEPERVDEELDLLLGALRERVAEVRRPEELGDRVEPVLADRRVPGTSCRHVGAAPTVGYFASAQLGPKPMSTTSGTRSSVTRSITSRTSGSVALVLVLRHLEHELVVHGEQHPRLGAGVVERAVERRSSRA